MLRSLIFILLIIASSFNLSAASLNGTAPGAEGKKLRIYVYDDLISSKTNKIAETIIDKDGNFNAEFELKYTSVVRVTIDFYNTSFYMQGGDDFRMDINTFINPKPPGSSPVYPYGTMLHYDFASTVSATLNDYMDTLDILYNEYVMKHLRDIIGKGKKAGLDTLKNYFRKSIPLETYPYLETAVDYRIALLEETSGFRSDHEIINKYFVSRPVQYHHPDYIYLFRFMFRQYLVSKPALFDIYEIEDIIKNKKGLAALDDYIGRDKMLVNEQLRELFILHSIEELFWNKEFSKVGLYSLLKDMKVNSKFPEHRKIASNIITEHKRLSGGSIAPGFDIKDNTGNIFTNDSLAGKYIYLQFWTTWCDKCVAEMEVLRTLNEKYEKDISFISFSVDTEVLEYNYFIEKNSYPWLMAHFDNDYDLLNRYRIRTFPTYIFISREGRIISAPANSPDEGFEAVLAEILREERIEMLRKSAEDNK